MFTLITHAPIIIVPNSQWPKVYFIAFPNIGFILTALGRAFGRECTLCALATNNGGHSFGKRCDKGAKIDKLIPHADTTRYSQPNTLKNLTDSDVMIAFELRTT